LASATERADEPTFDENGRGATAGATRIDRGTARAGAALVLGGG